MKACAASTRTTRRRPCARKSKLAQKATIRYPVDGKYLMGNWKEGEKIAAHGRGGHIGFIQPDAPMTPRGGNCYACHQLAPKEIAYGTIGPSLQHFGKLRGNSDDIVKYAYDKIYNSNAFNACSNMPRFGMHNPDAGGDQTRRGLPVRSGIAGQQRLSSRVIGPAGELAGHFFGFSLGFAKISFSRIKT